METVAILKGETTGRIYPNVEEARRYTVSEGVFNLYYINPVGGVLKLIFIDTIINQSNKI